MRTIEHLQIETCPLLAEGTQTSSPTPGLDGDNALQSQGMFLFCRARASSKRINSKARKLSQRKIEKGLAKVPVRLETASGQWSDELPGKRR